MRLTILRPVPSRPLIASVALVALVAFGAVACGSGRVRDANAPLSPEAEKVEVISAPKPDCKKLGTVNGIGEDLDDKVSDTQATNAAREEAAKMGGNAMVMVTTTADAKAGSGGTVQVIKKTADVFACDGQ
jgi:hypothetical protein